ncbi:MAG: DUF108 domain-containing protein [Candidatus Omnitrophica bacterium]|nr:DUF108 domain-containing protein [Candidatus Omnitrophota bacterium]
MKKIKIGLIGYGAIGKVISKTIKTRFSDKAILYAVSELNNKKIKEVKRNFKSNLKILDINTLIKKSDLVVEAANPFIAREVVNKALSLGKDVMVLSSGGVIKDYIKFAHLAKKNRCRLYLVSGALSGIDALKAASFGRIKKITLTSKKPVKALLDAPYIKEKGINLKDIRNEETIFEGSVKEAIKGFPKNINVSATVSLATLMKEKIRVRILASPLYKFNTHELLVEGDFGKILSRVESKPSQDNPRTSQIAILSALATLRDILGYIRVGT